MIKPHAFHLEPHKSAIHCSDTAITFITKCHVGKKYWKPTWSRLNRCLGLLSLLSTARWWSSRFERQEAHELTNRQEALRCRGHAKPWQTNCHKSNLAAQFWHSTTLVSNLSTPCLWKWQTTLRLQNKQARKSPCSAFPTTTEALQHREQFLNRGEVTVYARQRLPVARHQPQNLNDMFYSQLASVYKRLAAISA